MSLDRHLRLSGRDNSMQIGDVLSYARVALHACSACAWHCGASIEPSLLYCPPPLPFVSLSYIHLAYACSFLLLARPSRACRLQVAPRNTVSLTEDDHSAAKGPYATPPEPRVTHVATSWDASVLVTLHEAPDASPHGGGASVLQYWDRASSGKDTSSASPRYELNSVISQPHRWGLDPRCRGCRRGSWRVSSCLSAGKTCTRIDPGCGCRDRARVLMPESRARVLNSDSLWWARLLLCIALAELDSCRCDARTARDVLHTLVSEVPPGMPWAAWRMRCIITLP